MLYLVFTDMAFVNLLLASKGRKISILCYISDSILIHFMGVFERGKQIILTFSYALLSREGGEIIGMAVYWAYN